MFSTPFYLNCLQPLFLFIQCCTYINYSKRLTPLSRIEFFSVPLGNVETTKGFPKVGCCACSLLPYVLFVL